MDFYLKKRIGTMSNNTVVCDQSIKSTSKLSNKASKFSLHVGMSAILLASLSSIFVKGHTVLLLEIVLLCLFFYSMPKQVISKMESSKALSLIVPMCVGIHFSASFF